MSPDSTESSERSADPDLYGRLLGESGPPIVFLHGLFGQGRNWTTIGKILADDHRVLLLDLPNHGRSGWTDRVDYPQMADQVAAALRAWLPRERTWSVIGHSMGGKVAMLLALRHPELVERLAVLDIAPVRYQRMSAFGGYVQAMRSIDLAALSSRAEAETAITNEVPDPVVRGFLLQNLRRDSGTDGPEWRWQMNLHVLGDQLDRLGDWPSEARDSGTYPGPVLWVGGAESDYIQPSAAPVMRGLFPAVRMITVKNAGHWVHSEQPEVVTAILRRFLAG